MEMWREGSIMDPEDLGSLLDWVEVLGFQFAAVGPALRHSLRKFMLHGFVHLPTDFNCFNVLSVSNCILHTVTYYSIFV